jgi:ABC-2 type transport system ATP-binding protein
MNLENICIQINNIVHRPENGAVEIEVVGLTKKYGDFLAVDDVSFKVNQGEILGYLGPNGAGKSTTVKMLTGILAPSAGRILIDGRDLRDDALSVKQRIGYVPESGGLYESLSGFEFLQLAGRLYHLDDAVIGRKAHEILRLFDLEGAMHDRLSSYSKGMKQKVLIGSALIHNPDVLFFDEPLSGLDANSMLVFKELVRHLAEQGKTIFYCSHVLEVVERLCPRAIIIDRGKVIADARMDELKKMTAEASLEGVFKQLTDATDASEIARAFGDVVLKP